MRICICWDIYFFQVYRVLNISVTPVFYSPCIYPISISTCPWIKFMHCLIFLSVRSSTSTVALSRKVLSYLSSTIREAEVYSFLRIQSFFFWHLCFLVFNISYLANWSSGREYVYVGIYFFFFRYIEYISITLLMGLVEDKNDIELVPCRIFFFLVLFLIFGFSVYP